MERVYSENRILRDMLINILESVLCLPISDLVIYHLSDGSIKIEIEVCPND